MPTQYASCRSLYKVLSVPDDLHLVYHVPETMHPDVDCLTGLHCRVWLITLAINNSQHPLLWPDPRL